MTKKKRYKRYSPGFKREALKRASEESVTDVIVCEKLGVNTRQLRRCWNSHLVRILHEGSGNVGSSCTY